MDKYMSWEKHSVSLPVCLLLLSHYHHTYNTSDTRCMGHSPHQAILCDTNWVSYNLIHISHYLPGDSVRSHRIKAQSHEIASHFRCQSQVLRSLGYPQFLCDFATWLKRKPQWWAGTRERAGTREAQNGVAYAKAHDIKPKI